MRKISLIAALFYTFCILLSANAFAEENVAPEVSITGLQSGTKVNIAEKLTISARITDDTSVEDVNLYINNVLNESEASVEGDVYTFSDIYLTNIGDVKIEVVGKDEIGESGSDIVNITAVKTIDVPLAGDDYAGVKIADEVLAATGSDVIDGVETQVLTIKKSASTDPNATNISLTKNPAQSGKFVLTAHIKFTSGIKWELEANGSLDVIVSPGGEVGVWDGSKHAVKATAEVDGWHSIKYTYDTSTHYFEFYLDDVPLSDADGAEAYKTTNTAISQMRITIRNISESDYLSVANPKFYMLDEMPYPLSVLEEDNSFRIQLSDAITESSLEDNVEIYYGDCGQKYELESIVYDDTAKQILVTPKTPVISSLEHMVKLGDTIGTSTVVATDAEAIKFFNTQSSELDVYDFSFKTIGNTVGAAAKIRNMSSEEQKLTMVMVLIDEDGAVAKDGVFMSDKVTVPPGTEGKPVRITPVAIGDNTFEVFFVDDNFKSLKNYIYK